MIIGIIGVFDIATVLPGTCLIIISIIYQYTVYIGEYNDTGSITTNNFKLKLRPSEWTFTVICSLISDNCETIYLLLKRCFERFYDNLIKYLNMYNHCQYIYYNGMIVFMIWILIWILIIFISNSSLFSYTLYEWYDVIDKQENGLINGNLDINCSGRMCALNRKVIKYGPLSDFYPWA